MSGTVEKALGHYSSPCCKNLCLWKIPFDKFLEYRRIYSEKSQIESSKWLKAVLTDETGDVHPENGNLYIPRYIHRNSLYQMYKNHHITLNLPSDKIPSDMSFYRTLDNNFQHVKFLRDTVLGRCDFCMSIPNLKKDVSNESQLKALSDVISAHHELHTKERMLYSSRCSTAALHPQRVLHLIFDCPDAYEVPHIVPVTKESGSLNKLDVKAVGFINHSADERYLMFFLDEYPKDANLIITCLYLQILQHFNFSKPHPSILWLQADNCSGENKNQ